MKQLAGGIFLLLFSLGISQGQEVFEVRGTDGKKTEGTLSSWGPNSGFTLAQDGKPVRLDNPALLIRKDARRPPPLAKNSLWFSREDSLSFTKIELVDDLLRLDSPDLEFTGKGAGVSVLEARLAWWDKPQGIIDRGSYLSSLLKLSLKKDLLVLKNSDRLEGILETLEDQIGWEGAQGKVKYPIGRISALLFTQEGAGKKDAPAAALWVCLKSGARFHLEKSKLEKGMVHGEIAGGSPVRFPVENLVEATWMGSARFLTSSDATGVTPPESREFFLGGSCFTRGIALKGSSSVKVVLEPMNKRFMAWLGMDEIHGRLGKGDFWVRSSGKELGRWRDVSLETGPVEVNLDVSGLKELELGVDMAPGLGAFQQGDWVNCLLTR